MTLKIIGAGFGRTGTMSLMNALEQLGFGPCHHMSVVNADDEQKKMWRRIAAGEAIPWETALEGFGSAVDWPAAHYWRELAETYPEAKVILTVRSPDSWLASMKKTILPALQRAEDSESVGVKLLKERVFEDRLDDDDFLKQLFEKNTREVQSAFDSSRLLTYELGAGWEPLCSFLGVPVPESDYPSSNSAESFNSQR